MANITSVITYNANLSAAQAQIKLLTGQIAGLTAAFNGLDKAALKAQRGLSAQFAANIGQIGGFTAQQITATSSVENFGKAIAANKLTMRQYFREAFAGYTKQNSMMRQLATQQVRMQQSMVVPMGGGQGMLLTPQSINRVSSAAQLATQRFSIFNQLIAGGSERLLNFGKNTQWAGRQLMVGFTIPMTIFGALVSKVFRDLDKELTRFEKVYGDDIGGTVVDTTKQMRREVQELAFEISRSFGIASSETAALAADFAQTGKAGKDLLDAVRLTTRLSVLGDLERQQAMKATLSIQSAFRQNTNELAESIDFLNAVENETIASISDLTEAIPRVGPVIQALGGDVKDLATLLVAMREGGVSAAEGANALKSGLGRIINPTKRAQEVAAGFGVNLVEIVQANRGQLMPMILELQSAMQSLDQFARAQIVEQVFGKFQFARMFALFENLGRQGSMTQRVIELAAMGTADLASIANKELTILQESAAMRFTRAMEEVKNSLIPIGEVMTETLIPIMKFLTSAITNFTDFIAKLPGPVKNFGKLAFVLTALVGPVVMLVGLFGNFIAQGIKGLQMLVQLGARISGLRVEKFELLTSNVMAARLGVDTLTGSFVSQENALIRLAGVMATYETSLRRLTTANPALFVPGAGQPPIRRQAGSMRPERVPGQGRGDKIPAMLEPGEFVMNRAATQRFAPVLMAMNRGNIPGFQTGGSPSDKVGKWLEKYLAAIGGRGEPTVTSGGSYSRPDSISRAFGLLEHPEGVQQARGHFSGSGEFMKNLRLDKVAVQWHPDLWTEVTQAENQLLNTFQTSPPNRAALEKALVETGASTKTISRIMSAATRGIMVHNDDMAAYEKAIVQLRANSSVLTVKAKNLPEQTLAAAETLRARGMPGLVGASTQQLRGAQAVQLQQYQAIERRLASSPNDPILLAARQKLAAQITNLENHFKALGKTATEIPEQVLASIRQHSGQASPSVEADRVGKNLSDGFMRGASGVDGEPAGAELGHEIVSGFRSTGRSQVSARPSLLPAGPVGPGLESRSLIDATKREIGAKSLLEKALIKETQQRGLIADTTQRISVLQRQHNVSLANWTKDLETGRWVHKNGTVAGKKRTAALEKLAQEEALKVAQTKKLTAIEVIRERAEKNATTAAEAKIVAEKRLSETLIRRSVREGVIFTPGSYLMGGASPYAGKTDPFAPFNKIAATAGASSPLSSRPGGASGPGGSLSSARQVAQGPARGMGAMNAMFAMSMLVSSVTMLGGASSEAASKLGMFTTALMTATLVMNTGMGKGMLTNFLGMKTLGAKIGGTSAARLAANPALAQRAAGIASAGGLAGGRMAGAGAVGILGASGGKIGSSLLLASRAISVLGGPVGIAAGIAVTGIIAGVMKYRSELEDARLRAIAAFKDPVKTAEFFGQSITNLTKTLERNRLADTINDDLNEVDENLKKAVAEDYEFLVERIRRTTALVGARELSTAFSSMLISGVSAENAKAAIVAIASEAGLKGGDALAEAFKSGFLEGTAIEDAVKTITSQFDLTQDDVFAAAIQRNEKAVLDLEKKRQDIINAARADAENRPVITPSTPPGFVFPGTGERVVRPGGEGPLVLSPEEFRQIADLDKEIQEINSGLSELSTVNFDKASESISQLVLAYAKAPQAALDSFTALTEAAERSGKDLQPILKEWLETNMPEEFAEFGNKLLSTEDYIAAIKMAIAGVDFRNAIDGVNGFDSAMANAVVTTLALADAANIAFREAERTAQQIFSTLIEEEKSALQARKRDIRDKEEKDITSLEKRLFGMKKDLREQEIKLADQASQWKIDDIQREMDAERKALDQAREKHQEKMKALDEEKQRISEGANAYIESLKKRSRADSFFAKQRETSLSALAKLASGDVFGFLQERGKMSEDAQQFSYDEEIRKIEERRDLEVKTIEDRIKKQQEAFDKYQKGVEDQLKAQQTLIDAERDAQYYRNRYHQQAMNEYDAQRKTIEDNAKKQVRVVDNKLKEITTIEKQYQTDSETAEKRLSKILGEEKTKPFIEQRKEMMKNKILEIWYRGGTTLRQAAQQAGAFTFPTVSADAAERNNPDAFLRSMLGDLGINIPLGPVGQGLDTKFDIPRSRDALEDGSITTDDITINSPDNVYINGAPIQGNATGGYISGPGGPKEDKIPAMLSNGEYVIRASSVSKYGKAMMDSINVGRFADGGMIQGYKYGGSADRQEYAASKKPVYFGGTPTSSTGYKKPAPAYSGGTPTYSGGYKTANTQATKTSGYKSKIWKQPPVKTGGGFLGDMIFSGIREGFADFINTTILGNKGGTLENVVGRNISGNRLYGQRSGIDKSIGNALFGLDLIPFLGGSVLAGKASLTAARAAMKAGKINPAPGPAQYTRKQGAFTELIEQKYGDQILGHLVRHADNQNISGLAPGMTLEPYVGTGQAVSAFVRKHALTVTAQRQAASVAAGLGDKPIRIMLARRVQQNIDAAIDAVGKSSKSAYKLTEDYKTNPSAVIKILSDADPKFATLSTQEKREITSFLASNSFNTKEAKRLSTSGGFDSARWSEGQVNMVYPGPGNFGALNTIAHEMGHTTDYLFRRSGFGRAGARNSMQRAIEYGRTEAYAESNRLRAIKELMETTGVDPSLIKRFTREGAGVGPYQLGVQPESYANSPLFKIAYALQMRRNMRGKDALFDTRGFSMRKSGIYKDIVTSTPEWMYEMIIGKLMRGVGYADGGLVKGYKDGDYAAPERGLMGALSFVGAGEKPRSNPDIVPPGTIPTPTTPPTTGNANDAALAMRYALAQRGKPYSLNANPPSSWDCSKLTAWAYNVGVPDGQKKYGLISYSHTQANQLSKRVTGLRNGRISGLTPGDLLYFKTDGPSRGHTSMFIGNDQIVEASAPGIPVRTTSLNNGWNNGYRSSGGARFQWAGPPRAKYSTPSPGGSTPSPGSGSGPSWAKKFILSKGVSNNIARTLFGIVMKESGGNPKKMYPTRSYYNWTSAGSPYYDTGLFQINNKHLSRVRSMFGKSQDMRAMLDVQKNWLLAKSLTNGYTKFRDWGIASNGTSPDWTGWPATSWSKAESFRNYMYHRGQFDKYANGGFISGPGGPKDDKIPALLSNGEYVVRASSVAKYGKDMMKDINAGQFGMGGMAKKYADGGLVGSMSGVSMPSFNTPFVPRTPAPMSSGGFVGSTNNSSNSSNVKIVINGAGNKGAKAIANQVISMINEANGKRNHSRSI